MNRIVLFAAIVIVAAGLFFASSKKAGMESTYDTLGENTQMVTTPVVAPDGLEVATFAAGCFWCSEAVFQETEGIGDVISGYVGGQEEDPTYEEVYTHTTGHREGVQFFFDPTVISYPEILDILWQSIDPTDSGGQFVDRGFAYTTAVFYHNDTQKRHVERSVALLEASGRFERPIVTKILPYTTFYIAEDYHQDFYKNASERYTQYESNSGREEYKAAIWNDIRNSERERSN